MKQFFVKWGSSVKVKLDATNKLDAIDEVKEKHANSGIMTVLCREYTLTNRKEFKVDTDW